MDITEILMHHNESHPYGSMTPPIFQTSNFSFKDFDSFKEALMNEDSSYIYSRGNNPTVNLLEEKISLLEHTQRTKLVSSGAAAISQSVLSFVKSGDHIVSVKDTYSWARKLFDNYLPRFGINTTYVEGTDIKDFEKAIQKNTKIIYLESPTTFTFKLQNLKQVANLAKSYNIKTIIDNTWATPINQNPYKLGIDIVIHSASKYLGGNSDIIGGIISGSNEDIKHIFNTEFMNIGTVPDPFMAWLIIRGMRTLELRLKTHYENTLKIIDFLDSHPKAESILYPFYKNYPQLDLAKKQMKAGTGLFSFKLKTKDLNKVKEFTNTIKYFKKAVSWGGYESLMIPHAVTQKEPDKDLLPLIRLHVGLENPEILIKDLEKGLKII